MPPRSSVSPAVDQKKGVRFRSYLCCVCLARKATLREACDHVKVHHPVEVSARGRGVRCRICSTSFGSEREVREHRKRVNARAVFMCQKCGAMLRSRRNLENHEALHEKTFKYRCRLCDDGDQTLRFQSMDQLMRHKRLLHADARAGGGRFFCEKCGKSGFFSRRNLENHLNSHENLRKFICKVCQLGFNNQYSLTAHARSHSKVRIYRCDWKNCEKTYSYAIDLYRHKMAHSKIFPFVCAYCGLGYFKKTLLLRHFERRHALRVR